MTIIPKYDERSLLLAMAEGDESAFVAIFRHYQDHIFKVAFQFVRSQALAEEVVQDVFLKVWEKRSGLFQLDSFRSWLFIVSRNYLYSYMQRMALDKSVRERWVAEHPLYENTSDYSLREAKFSELLSEIISSLPTQQQQVFRLAREKYMSYAEIAGCLSISPNTVRIHMSRALAFIRKSLKDKGVDYLLFFAIFYPV